MWQWLSHLELSETTAQASFVKVKHMIVNSSVLALFAARLQTILSTDAPHYSLGVVLRQIMEQGTEQTVAFASQSLSEAERKYSIV